MAYDLSRVRRPRGLTFRLPRPLPPGFTGTRLRSSTRPPSTVHLTPSLTMGATHEYCAVGRRREGGGVSTGHVAVAGDSPEKKGKKTRERATPERLLF